MSEKYLGEVSTPLLINQIKENCAQKRTTLPLASIDELGNTYQYMGVTSGSLVHGYSYECVSDGQDPATYSWQQVNTQPTAPTPTAATTTFDNTTSGLQATNVQGAIDEVVDGLGTAASKDFTPNVAPNNHNLVESNAVYNAITTALTSIYTPRGDLSCAELTSSLLIAANVGNIYEMSDSGTTSALFLQGAGKTIHVGDNVGIIQTGVDTYKFNLMANAFDMTDYQKKDLTSAVEGATTVEGALGALSANKQDSLTFDDAPTENSNNPVKSGGVYEANSSIYEVMGELGAKNLIPYPYDPPYRAKQTKSNGITYTVNDDGSVVVNGTKNNVNVSQFYFFLDNDATQFGYQTDIFEVGKTYRLTGCPSDGGVYTYRIRLILNYNRSGEGLTSYNYSDNGQGVTFTIQSEVKYARLMIDIGYNSETYSVSNLLFKPMLRLAEDTDGTFRPYAPTNRELYEMDNNLYKYNGIMGAKNLIPYPYYGGKTFTNNGITFTANDDGSIVINGTLADTTIDSPFALVEYHTNFENTLNIKTTEPLLLSGSHENKNCQLQVALSDGQNMWAKSLASSNGNERIFKPIDGYDEYNISVLRLVIPKGTTDVFDNDVVYPMLRLASDTDPTWQPYAKTNRELTEKIDIVGNLFTTTTKVVDNITHGIATTIAILENLPIGIYVVSGQFNSDGAMSGGGLIQFASSGVIQNGASCNPIINQGFKANAGLTGIFNVTNATNQINLQIYTATADLTVSSARLAAIRIA